MPYKGGKQEVRLMVSYSTHHNYRQSNSAFFKDLSTRLKMQNRTGNMSCV